MNQLLKTEEGIILKSDKVCLIPNLINLQHEEIFGKSDKKSIASMKKKYSAPLRESQKKDGLTFSESQKKRSENQLLFKD
jgi:hypothetical protein